MGAFGVWAYCDNCGHDTWVVAWERDYLDEAITHICGGGCETCPECIEEGPDWDDGEDAQTPAPDLGRTPGNTEGERP